MEQGIGKIRVQFEGVEGTIILDKDAIFIGRMRLCDIRLDHRSVSRIHAGINFLDSEFFLINLSSTNLMTLNGRLLAPKKTDVLSDGDIIQIGPFVISAQIADDELTLSIHRQFISERQANNRAHPHAAGDIAPERASVLKVFWEKRTREKEDWGTLLRPAEKPQPGKSMVNWKPTGDLRRSWRAGMFVWPFVIIGAIGFITFFRYPQAFAEKPLADPHAAEIENSAIAATSNGNSCTTCHAANEPIENACIRCHQAEQFHASNTLAHQEAAVTCVVCHREHQGAEFEMKPAAVKACAECHNDNNAETYNGKKVRTPHGGSFGYPVRDGRWAWEGLHSEIADTIPAAQASATKDESEQRRRSREFHVIHVGRLIAPAGMKADPNGRVSCSSCHDSFDPVDVETPRQTCAACHSAETEGRVNCVSCHVQHPFSENRWSEFLGDEAIAHRRSILRTQIRRLNDK